MSGRGQDVGKEQRVTAEFYWCTRHERVEPADGRCSSRFLYGPYDSEADARDHAAIADCRAEAWEEADERWESAGSGESGG